jgi:predicted nucleic acid-binding protein
LNVIVSNATPLIYLAKVGRLELIRKLYPKVYISSEVKKEVVDIGKKLKKIDAPIIEKEISKGWVIEYKVKGSMDIPIDIEIGEKTTLILAREKGIKSVLIDDKAGRAAARLLDLEPKGTLFILLKSLKNKEIGFNTLIKILEGLIEKGFRLREEVYLRVIKEARSLS